MERGGGEREREGEREGEGESIYSLHLLNVVIICMNIFFKTYIGP